jgi:membrane-bound metal-dependent hydrolase YbcI (DUF457 family)
MLGRDHALSGAVAFAGVAPLLHVSGVQLGAAVALTAGAGVLPDLDEPGSTIARTFGFLTGAFAWIVHKISGGHRKGTHSLLGVALLTAGCWAAGAWQHSAWAAGGRVVQPWHLVPAGLILALLFASGLRALHIGGHHADAAGIALAALVTWKGWDLTLVTVTSRPVPVLAVCTALGMLAHLAGDMCTHDGCPLLYPVSRYEFGLLPERIRITTNKLAEHWVVTPLLLAGLAYFAWRDAGPAVTSHSILAGR